ncbi:cardiolipin synthase [Noviherbaspirillum humi]|uniref:Cardiolipin synthase B n=1 Tax=Noviherbaspirillum humi TaxID=1688639 RepID=A0A239L3W4_9BURK|nr:cardiolipin synthase ClsB [Noviherbaspirillum humi]SNT25131.1 cardiolipin synthase [Noviherbaspirillum humi]
MNRRWTGGNRFSLLENGEEFYPKVFEAIARAEREVMLETFILYEDKVGLQLHQVLLEAARRGVQIDLTIDGWGSPSLSQEFIGSLTAAGVRFHVFDPGLRLLRRLNLFRRMHRKLVVVDGKIAFVGGINYSADHLGDFGPEAKQDYAVQAEGPIVAQIHAFMRAAIAAGHGRRHWFRRRQAVAQTPAPAPAGEAEALFVWRDNNENKRAIERQYRLAIRLAQRRVVIANAYFFPGWAFLRDLRRAARRGVQVDLILQGNPDMQIVQIAAAMLYHHLLRGGVRIYEYCARPLHGKVAVVDDEWATVGSSNLDPLSLSLNLEANVMIRDRGFNHRLRERLDYLIRHSCKQIRPEDVREPEMWRQVRSFFLFHFLRRFPSWVGWLPAHTPRLDALHDETLPEGADRLEHTTVP